MSPDLLSVLTGSALRGTVVLAAAGVATLALWQASAAVRHAVWAVATTAAVLVPVALLLPTWPVLPGRPPAPTAPAITALGRRTTVDPAAHLSLAGYPSHVPPAIDVVAVMPAIWMAGCIACLLPSGLGLLYLSRLRRRCRPVDQRELCQRLSDARRVLGVRRPVALLTRDEPTVPMTWGVLRPTVLLPTAALDWSAERQRAVLLHEVAHVARLDCLTHTLGRLARDMHWFNPLAWVAVWRMSVERERACDDAVLAAGVRPSAYAADLLAVAADRPRFGLAMARPSRLGRRVADVLDDRRPAGSGRSRWAAGLLAACVAVPMAVVRAGPPGATLGGDPYAATRPSDLLPASDRAPAGWTRQTERAAECAKSVAMLCWGYSVDHHDRFPVDLGQSLQGIYSSEFVGRPATDGRPPEAGLGEYYLTPEDQRRTTVPAVPTADWINQHTSFTYLAADADLKRLENGVGYIEPGVIVLHTPLATPYHTPGGDVVVVAYLNPRAGILPVAEARAAIETSKKYLVAARVPAGAAGVPALARCRFSVTRVAGGLAATPDGVEVVAVEGEPEVAGFGQPKHPGLTYTTEVMIDRRDGRLVATAKLTVTEAGKVVAAPTVVTPVGESASVEGGGWRFGVDVRGE